MTTLYNFALTIEIVAKKVAKPILETWNANDVIVYVWLIHSWIKKVKKSTKFAIKIWNNSDWIHD